MQKRVLESQGKLDFKPFHFNDAEQEYWAFRTSDNKFHINYEGYSWKTATLNNMREQYKYIKDKQNFHKYDDKMENLIDKYNNEPTKEQLAFMSIEQRYRNKK